ncbi:glycosyltransferase [Psychrobacillus sp. OK032]|uniref:glycosyltransferase n=1 Tax=Psychrobacillus sp. OK032 TaxID=1884358 RepID=UPI0008CD2854|nr:glycosyltransferase [Psychrobacillus sp. OK032]SER70923.1 Glycosyltransferase involved in cell wall bisynthesis [Psychrobacillus sp. OK032]
MDKKKVVVISYVFSLSNTVRAYAVYKALKNDYETSVIYADYDHYSKQHITYTGSNFKSIHVPGYKRNMSIMRIVSTVCFGINTVKLIKKASPDAVYVICPPNLGSYIASLLCKKRGIPCLIDIVDLHPESIPINKKLKPIVDFLGLSLWKKFRNIAIENADKVIVECNYYKKVIKEKYLKKTSTVYIAKHSAINEGKVLQVETGIINIVYLGSIGHIYDFETLINIGKGLLNKGISFKLHIIGDGEKRDWLTKQLKKNNIPYSFYGKIYEESEKAKIMEICDFGFNGFKDETSVGLSYKSLDYMDYGLALINSTKEDTWNLINEYNAGINYFSNELQDLIDEIAELNKEEILKMKINSRKLFELFFDSHIFEENIKREINDLI